MTAGSKLAPVFYDTWSRSREVADIPLRFFETASKYRLAAKEHAIDDNGNPQVDAATVQGLQEPPKSVSNHQDEERVSAELADIHQYGNWSKNHCGIGNRGMVLTPRQETGEQVNPTKAESEHLLSDVAVSSQVAEVKKTESTVIGSGRSANENNKDGGTQTDASKQKTKVVCTPCFLL